MAVFAPIATIALGLVVSYLCGSIPVGLIIGRLTQGIDIREYGSGNVGATNVMRTLGLKPGLIVMAGDIAKGAVGCLVMVFLLDADIFGVQVASSISLSEGWLHDLALSFAVVSAVAGHMFSPFMGFKGGKGIATAFGSLCVVIPLSAFICLGVFIIVCLLTRYVSLGSICATLSLPLSCALVAPGHLVYLLFCIIVAILIVFAHRSNIKRLLTRTEHRFTIGERSTKR
jgi:acyl phosphate:glycerol-3-phosphate acyltransferase